MQQPVALWEMSGVGVGFLRQRALGVALTSKRCWALRNRPFAMDEH